ncbi:MAG: carotenoid oxygenase family protein, partial [Polyangiaceae bacterium]
MEGKVPVDLGGYFFVTAPVGTVETNGLPYDDPAHFLNGDGMVYRYGFHNGTVKVRTRLSKPPCFYADLATKTGSPYEALGFKNFGVARASLRLGARDYVNTAMMVMEMPGEIPRLFLTYDAGRPYEIDTESCEVVTPIGSNAEWRPEGLEHLPFTPNFSSAHPFADGHT